jgi:hypothetical protein
MGCVARTELVSVGIIAFALWVEKPRCRKAGCPEGTQPESGIVAFKPTSDFQSEAPEGVLRETKLGSLWM